VPQEVTITASVTPETGAPQSFTTDVANPAGLTFAWNFGDGGTDSSTTPTHTFAKSGNYTVTVTVSNAAGNSVKGSTTPLLARHYTNVAGLQCAKANSGGWCWENDLVTGHALTQGQFFASKLSGWVIGKAGTLVYTANGGDTWALHTFPALDDLDAELFSTASNGVVLMQSGVVQQTADGKTWTATPTALPVKPATNASFALYNLAQAPLTAVNIVLTDSNVTQSSTDGGTTWMTLAMTRAFAAGLNCWSVGTSVLESVGNSVTGQACNTAPVAINVGAPVGTTYLSGSGGNGGNRVVILGKNSSGLQTYSTQNGGKSWANPHTQTFAQGGTLTVVDNLDVWYLDPNNQAYLSIDGGNNFAPANIPVGAGASLRAGLVDTVDQLFYAWQGGLAVSTDFGSTFALLPSPEPYTLPAAGGALHFNIWNARTDGNYDAMVSYGGRYYVAHDAHNGGATWVQVLGPNAFGLWQANPSPVPPSIAFGDAKHGTLALPTGLVQTTGDGGQTWSSQLLATPPAYAPASVVYTSPTTAWMTLNGSLWASTDAGVTWTASSAVPGATYTAWPDATHGWTVTPDGIFASADGGATWAPLSFGSTFAVGSDHVNSVAFESPTAGVVGVVRSDTLTHLLVTADGGLTWNEFGTASAGGMVASTGGTDFWVSGSVSQHSGDGGQTWTALPLPGASLSFAAFGASGGAVLGTDNNGDVIATNNLGLSWVNLTLSSDVATGAGFVLDDYTYWTVNQLGNVLATVTAAQ
jgi:PKD repeat protein